MQSEPDPFDLVSLHSDDSSDDFDFGGPNSIETGSIETISTPPHDSSTMDDYRNWASWKQIEFARSSRISGQLVDRLIEHSPISPAKMDVFMDALYVVEMFNRFLYAICYQNDQAPRFGKIEFQRFLSSLVNDDQKYFESFVRTIVGVFFIDRFPGVNFLNQFLGEIGRVGDDEMSVETLIYVLTQTLNPKYKISIFEGIEDIMSKLDSSIQHLSIKEKLTLCRNLIDFLCFKVSPLK